MPETPIGQDWSDEDREALAAATTTTAGVVGDDEGLFPQPTDPDDDDSPLAALLAEAARTDDLTEPQLFPVPAREGWEIEARTNLEQKTLDRFYKAATKGKTTDGMAMNLAVIAEATIGLRHRGKPLLDTSTGEPLVFGSDEVMDAFRVPKGRPVAEVVKRFIGRDGDVASLAEAILHASGYGQDAEGRPVERPTRSG